MSLRTYTGFEILFTPAKEALKRPPQFVINGTIQVRVSDIPEFIRSSNVVAAQTLEEPGCVSILLA